MKTITSHSQLVDLFNEEPNRPLDLHLERDCGTHSIPFHISTGEQIIAAGIMDTETDADGDFTSELAFAVMGDLYESFATITEYDSLVAATNPGIVRVQA